MSNPSNTDPTTENGLTEIPKTTKRWVIRNFTGPDGLEMEGAPIPELGPNDVLVKRKPRPALLRHEQAKQRKKEWGSI